MLHVPAGFEMWLDPLTQTEELDDEFFLGTFDVPLCRRIRKLLRPGDVALESGTSIALI